MRVVRAVKTAVAEDYQLVPVLLAIFVFNLGSAAWSAGNGPALRPPSSACAWVKIPNGCAPTSAPRPA